MYWIKHVNFVWRCYTWNLAISPLTKYWPDISSCLLGFLLLTIFMINWPETCTSPHFWLCYPLFRQTHTWRHRLQPLHGKADQQESNSQNRNIFITVLITILTRHVFVKHVKHVSNKVQIWQKSLSPIFWPRPIPGGCDVSEVWGTHRWTYSPSLVTTVKS